MDHLVILTILTVYNPFNATLPDQEILVYLFYVLIVEREVVLTFMITISQTTFA